MEGMLSFLSIIGICCGIALLLIGIANYTGLLTIGPKKYPNKKESSIDFMLIGFSLIGLGASYLIIFRGPESLSNLPTILLIAIVAAMFARIFYIILTSLLEKDQKDHKKER